MSAGWSGTPCTSRPGPALAPGGRPSHAYLFYGPGGAGKRAAARAMAAELLAEDPRPGRRPRPSAVRLASRPDLGRPERRPRDPRRRHRRPGRLGGQQDAVRGGPPRVRDRARRRARRRGRQPDAEDARGAGLVRALDSVIDRLAEVLPTIRSRCQLVRFDAPTADEIAAELRADRARTRRPRSRAPASPLGMAGALGSSLVLRATRSGRVPSDSRGRLAPRARWGAQPWSDVLSRCAVAGGGCAPELEARAAEEMELYPRKERKRIETEWDRADPARPPARRDGGARPRLRSWRSGSPTCVCLDWGSRAGPERRSSVRARSPTRVGPAALRAASSSSRTRASASS